MMMMSGLVAIMMCVVDNDVCGGDGDAGDDDVCVGEDVCDVCDNVLQL